MRFCIRPVSLAAVAVLISLGGCAHLEKTSKKPALTGPSPQDQAVALQIFLDARHFGPGAIDGHDGEFTRKALQYYRSVHGGDPDTRGIVPYTTCVITEKDVADLGPMASDPAEVAKQKRLTYVTLSERVAERYHTTKAFLAGLNAGRNIDSLPAGASVRVPNVAAPLDITKFPSAYPKPAPSILKTRHVVVDTHSRMLEVRDGGKLLAVFPITPGSSEHPAPIGEWRIVGVAPWPWFRYDEGVLNHGQRTTVFFMYPPGPNSPVGILWAGLNRPGTGIHGTSSPETIGRSGSHGCIRLANWDAAAFYTLVLKGVPVTIR